MYISKRDDALYENNIILFHVNFRNEEDKNVDLQNIIRTVFIDLPSEYNITYNFTKYPPKTSGQIGVPLIIDSLLGNVMVISSNETNKIILNIFSIHHYY